MVTTKGEVIQFMKIILDWCSPQVARSMLDDMDFYIADTTGNKSVKESIKMVRTILYRMSEESLSVEKEMREYNEDTGACCRSGKCEE